MLACLLFSCAFAADEPTFNGLKLSEWAAMAKDDPLPRKRRAAVIALGQLVTEKTKDAALGPVARLLRNDSQATVRLQAALVLGAQPVEILAGYLPEMTESLRQEKNAEVKRELAVNLGRLGKAAQAAVLPLIDALGDSPPVQAAAADALGKIGPGAHAATTPLLKLIDSTDRQVTLAAAFALGRIEPADPEPAVDALVQLLAKLHASNRSSEIFSAAVGGLPAAERDGNLVSVAVGSLAMLDFKTTPVVMAIAGALSDPDAEVRRQCALALIRMTVAARAADAELRRAIATDDDKLVRTYAIQAFAAAHTTEPAAMIDFLSERLNSEADFEVRIAIAEELGALGAAGAAALPALRDAQRDAQVKVREAAALAIRRITKPPPPPQPPGPP